MGSNSDGFSEETCHVTVTSQISVNAGDVLSSKSKTCKRNFVSSSADSVSNLGPKGSGKACNTGMLETQSTDASAHGGLQRGKVLVGPRECINLASSKEATTGATSEVSNKNSESKMDMDMKQSPVKDYKISNKVDHDEQTIKSAGLCDAEEHPLQSASINESGGSDIVEHDVKICDICGDAGREDLLAICSKCSDGAEHTYCMQEMLQKVPEGDWLCEECKFSVESESKKQDAEFERANKVSPITPNSGKKHAENMEVAAASRKHAVEVNITSPKSSSPHRTAMLSRDSSFNSLDEGKIRPSQKSFENQSGNDILETAHSPATSMRLHPPKGTLLKSNSFRTSNFKPKLKQVDEVPYRQKVAKEYSASDIKEGHRRTIVKSASYKSVIPGRLNASESKVKMSYSQFSHTQDPKVSKPTKDQNAHEWRKVFKQDRLLVTSNAVSSSVSSPKADSKLTPVRNNRDLKCVQSDGKLSTLTKSASSLARKVLETPVTSVGASDASGNIGSPVQKINQVILKDETASNASWTGDRPSNNLCVPDGLPRSGELLHQGESNGELPVSFSKHPVTMASRNFSCRKCKETGYVAECCTVSSPPSSGVDLSVARNLKEEMRRDSELKPAIEVAILKRPGIHKRKGDMKETDGLSTPKTAEKFEIASEERHYAYSPPLSVSCKTFAIPKPEYIWQGTFEVQKSGKVLDLCGPFQAHLSTCASPKVLEVVEKFPLKVALHEIPRLSTWPTQFQGHGVHEDNIALYFFAKDLESYEKSYMGLLNSLIKSDLALKGTVDGVELLIFPSNVLSENCQRWNMLFFLWGVFRGRRSNCSVSSSYSDTSKKLGILDSNAVPTLEEIPNTIPSISENIESALLTERKNSPACESICNAVQKYDTTNKTYVAIPVKGDSDKEVCLMEDICSDLQANCKQEDSELESKSSSNISSRMVDLYPQIEPNNPLEDLSQHIKLNKPTVLGIEIKGGSCKSEKTQSDALIMKEDISGFKKLPIQNGEKDVAGNIGEAEVADRMLIDGNGIKLERSMGRDNVNMETCLAGLPTIEGLNSKHIKYLHLDLSKQAPHLSNVVDQRLPWNKLNTIYSVDRANKKLKADYSEAYQCSSIKDVNTSPMHDTCSGCSIQDNRSEESCDEKVIVEDFGSAERSFFPVVTTHVKDFQFKDKSIPWKRPLTEDENGTHDLFPDLELALGADRKPPNKGLRPFFVGTVDRNIQNKPFDKMADAGEEDDPAASLSLSLSFPFTDKEQNLKSVSKTEQVLPVRHNVNTSLLLFGGLSDK